jgi:formylglycine-generating enzyme required for sulfatase activity
MTEEDPACCAASREERPSRDATVADDGSAPVIARPATDDDNRTTGMVRVDSGIFTMGTDSDVGFLQDGEGPAREVTVDSFYVGKFAVTNAQFAEFVEETGYTTDAERFGWSFVFEDFLTEGDRDRVMQNVPAAPWWVAVEGATWFRPEGPSSNVVEADLLKHPVTHVS